MTLQQLWGPEESLQPSVTRRAGSCDLQAGVALKVMARVFRAQTLSWTCPVCLMVKQNLTAKWTCGMLLLRAERTGHANRDGVRWQVP